jgi:phage major head subunit gpT-like protein
VRLCAGKSNTFLQKKAWEMVLVVRQSVGVGSEQLADELISRLANAGMERMGRIIQIERMRELVNQGQGQLAVAVGRAVISNSVASNSGNQW